MFDDESLKALNSRIEANANKLIDMGAKEWYRVRRKRKPAKTQQDQLREIEDSMLEEK